MRILELVSCLLAGTLASALPLINNIAAKVNLDKSEYDYNLAASYRMFLAKGTPLGLVEPPSYVQTAFWATNQTAIDELQDDWDHRRYYSAIRNYYAADNSLDPVSGLVKYTGLNLLETIFFDLDTIQGEYEEPIPKIQYANARVQAEELLYILETKSTDFDYDIHERLAELSTAKRAPHSLKQVFSMPTPVNNFSPLTRSEVISLEQGPDVCAKQWKDTMSTRDMEWTNRAGAYNNFRRNMARGNYYESLVDFTAMSQPQLRTRQEIEESLKSQFTHMEWTVQGHRRLENTICVLGHGNDYVDRIHNAALIPLTNGI